MNPVICGNMDGTREHCVKWNKPAQKEKHHMSPLTNESL
jgi:hypothetical protein